MQVNKYLINPTFIDARTAQIKNIQIKSYLYIVKNKRKHRIK